MSNFVLGVCFTLAIEFLSIIFIAFYYGGNKK